MESSYRRKRLSGERHVFRKDVLTTVRQDGSQYTWGRAALDPANRTANR